MSETSAARTLRTGPGRVLVAVYAVFALAATARGGFQLATKFHEAPLAYTLSLIAGVIYLVAAIGLARAGRTSRLPYLAAHFKSVYTRKHGICNYKIRLDRCCFLHAFLSCFR